MGISNLVVRTVNDVLYISAIVIVWAIDDLTCSFGRCAVFNFNTLEQRAVARQKVKDVYGDDLTVYSGLDAPGKTCILV